MMILAHFILDAVEALPLTRFRLNFKGTGSAQYPPRMLLSLLIYCYATGTFASRQIEALTCRHVSVRYLCANTHPDHDTICTFRRENKELLHEAFVQTLERAAQLQFLRVGTVAIDGTKLAASASKHSAVSHARAGELIARLDLEVKELLAKAEHADSTPLQDGLSIPGEIVRRQERKKKLEEARAIIEERARQRAEEQRPAYEEKVAGRAERKARGEKVRGRDPDPPDSTPGPKDQYNFTAPESRIMKAGSGDHFEQACNAQAAVETESLLIVGQRVSAAPNDRQQLGPTLQSIPASVGVPADLLVDTGFYSAAAIAQVERRADGTLSDITVYAAVEKSSHHRTVADLEVRPEPETPGPDASAKDQMRHRLCTSGGRAKYRLRKQTVEPVLGVIKEVLGFRRFLLRGLAKVALEWELVSLAWNLKRLLKLGLMEKLAARP